MDRYPYHTIPFIRPALKGWTSPDPWGLEAADLHGSIVIQNEMNSFNGTRMDTTIMDIVNV